MINFVKEVCVENLNQALKAEKKGADRIELCARLDLEGLTPSKQLIIEAKQQLNLPVRVMIRPRGGDFVYSKKEVETMMASIDFCRAVGVEGVVFGILDTNKNLNFKVIKHLINMAKPLKVVIHKAIDETNKPLEALKGMADIEGITTVLTSGGAKTAFEGKETLREMLKICRDGIEIMPAGKITNNNIHDLHHYLGATAYHGKCIVGKLQ